MGMGFCSNLASPGEAPASLDHFNLWFTGSTTTEMLTSNIFNTILSLYLSPYWAEVLHFLSTK